MSYSDGKGAQLETWIKENSAICALAFTWLGKEVWAWYKKYLEREQTKKEKTDELLNRIEHSIIRIDAVIERLEDEVKDLKKMRDMYLDLAVKR